MVLSESHVDVVNTAVLRNWRRHDSTYQIIEHMVKMVAQVEAGLKSRYGSLE